MNEYGWGLRECLAFLGAIALALFITMILYQKNFSELFDNSVSSKETYQDIENDLARLARNYTDNFYYKILENGDYDYVTVKELQKLDLLTNIVDIKNRKIHCSGYVHFYKEDGKTTYDPFIKCKDNYQTNGYNASHDVNVD